VDSWFFVENDGDRLRIRTSEAYVARRRRYFRGSMIVCALAGLALVALSPWFLALAAAALAGFAVAPRLFTTKGLLEIDRARACLVPLQASAGRGRSVPVGQLTKVSGVYEVYGWDPRSTIYAILANEQRVPILVFTGTNEALAEEACRLVGELLNSEATYSGPYGAPRVCFRP
jgi:hypothetical protein